MTAVVSVNTVAAPFGFLVAGQLLERWSVATVFALVAAGMTVFALLFSAIVLRHRDEDEPVAAAAPAVST